MSRRLFSFEERNSEMMRGRREAWCKHTGEQSVVLDFKRIPDRLQIPAAKHRLENMLYLTSACTHTHIYCHSNWVTDQWNIRVTASNIPLGTINLRPLKQMLWPIYTQSHMLNSLSSISMIGGELEDLSLTWWTKKMKGERLNVSSNVILLGTWLWVTGNHSCLWVAETLTDMIQEVSWPHLTLSGAPTWAIRPFWG